MFFEKELLSFEILDVIELKQKRVNMFNRDRDFSAISYRFVSDAVLRDGNVEYSLGDNYVTYVPKGLDYTRIASVDEMIIIRFDAVNYNGEGIECFLPSDPTTLSELFHRLLECWREGGTAYKYRCSAILYEILAECYLENRHQEPRVSKIQKSVDYILANYTRQDLRMGVIASQSFMSEVYFRRIFKQEHGISPRKYIINLRIQRARELISTGYYQLTEVAYMSGYSDYKYFSSEFKRVVGVSPSVYLALG